MVKYVIYANVPKLPNIPYLTLGELEKALSEAALYDSRWRANCDSKAYPKDIQTVKLTIEVE